MGRQRRRRPEPQATGHLVEICDRHPRRQSAALRALPVGGSARGDLSGAARVLLGLIADPAQVATGAGMVRNEFTACQKSWRLIASTNEGAAPGTITN